MTVTTSAVDPTFVWLETDHRVAYTEYGDPEGAPALFFHGTPGSRLLAALFDSAATEAGVRLLAFDRPGFGESDPWPTRSITDSGQFVTALLDDAGVQTARYIAFSGGSQHALAAAVTHHDRVSQLDIVSGATPPSISDETPAVQRVLGGLATWTPLVLRSLLRGQAWLAVRRAPSFVVSQYRTDDPNTQTDDEVADTVKADFVEALSNSRRGAVTEFRNTASEWNIDFSLLETPIHFWHGETDTNVPIADVRRFDAAVPDSTLTVRAHADHLQTLTESMPHILDRMGD